MRVLGMMSLSLDTRRRRLVLSQPETPAARKNPQRGRHFRLRANDNLVLESIISIYDSVSFVPINAQSLLRVYKNVYVSHFNLRILPASTYENPERT